MTTKYNFNLEYKGLFSKSRTLSTRQKLPPLRDLSSIDKTTTDVNLM